MLLTIKKKLIGAFAIALLLTSASAWISITRLAWFHSNLDKVLPSTEMEVEHRLEQLATDLARFAGTAFVNKKNTNA